MKNIYISQFVLAVPERKNELCARQLRKLKEAFQKTKVDYIEVLMILVTKNIKFKLWYYWNNIVYASFLSSIPGAIYVWILHHFFKKDVIENRLFSAMIADQINEFLSFMNDEKELNRVKPINKIGLFQHLTNEAFDHLSVHQFIEAYRCLISFEATQSDKQKEQYLNELLAYLFAPRIMWKMGLGLRRYFLSDTFLNQRKKKVEKLPSHIKILLYQYYLDNLGLLKLLYKNFYENPKGQKESRDVYTQYFSMKSLIQLRSENGTLSDKIKFMPARDLIESFEVEIIQAKIKMEK